MKSLLTIENSFQDYLLHANPAIFKHVVGTNKVPVEVRLGIYEFAYRSRLHEALMSSYPVLESYLGDDVFEALCYAYIASYPSSFRSIRWFGDKLATFLQQEAPYNESPYLAELAQFEWTMALVFDAADSDVLPLETMQDIPPDAWIDMRLTTHPSIHRLSLAWNVAPIWQAITEEETPNDPQQNATKMDFVLWRNGLTSQFSSLSEDEAWAIDAMIKGVTFGELCEGLCQWVDEEEAGMHAASLLKGWIMMGFITAVVIK